MSEVIIKVIGNYSYQTSKRLGEGVYGTVFQGSEKETKEKVAIKKIDIQSFTNDKYLENAIFSEIYLLKKFSHPNIVKFKDVLSSKNSLYIITEFCKNGDLKQLLKRRKEIGFTQQQAFDIMKQIISGFVELIREKIIHRDLKPANILINDGVFKIADFGFAKYVDNFGNQLLKSCVGSPIYMAPQILQRTHYSTKCDIWSLGVIFYEITHAEPPWRAKDQSQLLKKVKTIPIAHVLKRSNISERGKDFLKKTLAYNEKERISWQQLFEEFGPVDKKAQKLNELRVPSQLRSPISTTSPEKIKTLGSNQQIGKTQGFSPQLGSPERAKTNKHFSYDRDNQHSQNSTSLSRKLCMYLHFYNLQLFLNSNQVTRMVPQTGTKYSQLLFYIALYVKSKNHNIMNGQQKNIYGTAIQKKVTEEHETYEMLFNDICAQLEADGQLRRLKDETILLIGRNQHIPQQKMEAYQTAMMKIAYENAQILSEQVRKMATKNLKESSMIDSLDHILDVLSLTINKQAFIQQLEQQSRLQDQNITDHLNRVIMKVDKLALNI